VSLMLVVFSEYESLGSVTFGNYNLMFLNRDKFGYVYGSIFLHFLFLISVH
jgi:hypothetical protein